MSYKIQSIMAGILFITGMAPAHAQIYRVVLSGSSEIPAVSTTGSGSGIVTLNAVTDEMRVRANFSDLIGNTTASHIHCCVVQPANAGVATTVPTFPGFPVGVRSGEWDNIYAMQSPGIWNTAFINANGGTPAGAKTALINGANAGQAYLNVHSASFPGGEIRGTLLRHSFIPNATARTIGLAAALDSLGAGTGVLNERLVQIAAAPPAVQAAVMEQMLPTSMFATETLTSSVMLTTFEQISYRLQGLRLSSVNVASLVTPQTGDSGLWVKALYLQSDQDSDAGFAGFDSDGWDAALGFDSQVAANLAVGAALNYAENEADHDGLGGDSEISSLQATLYASHVVPGGGYVESLLAYARHDIDHERGFDFGGLATAGQDADQWGVRLGAGVVAALTDTVSFTPQVRFDWTRLELDGYTEAGSAGPFALQVDSKSAERVRASIGAQFDMQVQAGGTMRPFLRAFWNQHFDDDGIDATVRFATGTPFVAPGQALDRGYFSWGAGVNVFSSANLAASLSYDSTVADSYRSDVIQGKVYWAF